jgi:low temperature requirement protein LtrA
MLFQKTKPPTLRLPGEKEHRPATWLELFYDLVFVVAVAELSHRLGHDISLSGVLKFVALFIPVWWAWVGHTVYATRFDTDDIIHRLLTLFIMFGAAVMAVYVSSGLEGGASGYAAGYVLARICLLIFYVRARIHVPEARHMTTLYLTGFGLGALCWTISILLPPPVKFILWATGLGIDFITPWVGRKRILHKAPLDTSHFPERFGLFTIIVLGESVLAVVSGLPEAGWSILSLLTGLSAFILAVSIWWMYFTFIQEVHHECYLGSGQPFIYAHLSLVISLTAVGASISTFLQQANLAVPASEAVLLFCSAIAVWLISFFIVQAVSMQIKLLKLLLLPYAIGIIIITLLPFLWQLSPIVLLGIVDTIFILILVIELLVFKKNQQSMLTESSDCGVSLI